MQELPEVKHRRTVVYRSTRLVMSRQIKYKSAGKMTVSKAVGDRDRLRATLHSVSSDFLSRAP